jgi:hypothetical protein
MFTHTPRMSLACMNCCVGPNALNVTFDEYDA